MKRLRGKRAPPASRASHAYSCVNEGGESVCVCVGGGDEKFGSVWSLELPLFGRKDTTSLDEFDEGFIPLMVISLTG